MKYTKYNYKKRKNNSIIKFITSMLIGIIASCMIGLGVAWVIWKVLPQNDSAKTNSEIVDSNGNEDSKSDQDNKGITDTVEAQKDEFYFVQCGYFSKKENADQTLTKIASNERSFIYEDADKYRVISGAYGADEIDAVIQDLSEKGIESVKVTFELSEGDDVEGQVAAICDGYLKILTATFQDDVKSVKTDEFKQWVNTLENISEGDNIEKLQSLKDYISNLPDEIVKENVSTEMNYLYQVLSSFR